MTTPIYINITICPLEQVTEAVRSKTQSAKTKLNTFFIFIILSGKQGILIKIVYHII